MAVRGLDDDSDERVDRGPLHVQLADGTPVEFSFAGVYGPAGGTHLRTLYETDREPDQPVTVSVDSSTKLLARAAAFLRFYAKHEAVGPRASRDPLSGRLRLNPNLAPFFDGLGPLELCRFYVLASYLGSEYLADAVVTLLGVYASTCSPDELVQAFGIQWPADADAQLRKNIETWAREWLIFTNLRLDIHQQREVLQRVSSFIAKPE
jgi:hypothetical protein